MKLPFNLPGGGGGSGYHGFGDQPHYDADDLDIDSSMEEFANENDGTFDDYMWMENEEEFDKLEMERLEFEALITECMENAQDDDVWNDDDDVWNVQELQHQFQEASVWSHNIANSTLNPLAKEFIPSAARTK